MPPRSQQPAKRQQGAANQRDTRHENGLVGPGKRVQKQKSNGHLNGHAKQAESNSSTPPLPSTPPATNGHARQPQLSDSTGDHKMAIESMRRSSVGTYSESSSSESYHNMTGMSVSHENHRRIDVNAAKNPAVHRDMGPLSLALTVLQACPLYDTIAILIVLLQLPPTFLTLIHIFFATLTFVPPSTSAVTGFGFTDIFEGALGTPSFATIVVVDLIVLLIWLFLWGPLQDIALDLAQTVIALTLGGGTSGREAGINNVFVCFGIIGVSHFARTGNIKQSGLRAILSSSNGLLGSPDPDDPLEPVSQDGNKKGAHGWVRSIFAIHILAQGVVRYVRDWYVRRNLREKRDTATAISDPEAGKALTEGTTDSSVTNQIPDNDSSTSLPMSNTVINTKKKKKQSAQVRMKQPLWAALASTKIVMVKEYETSHTAAESAGTNATDINNLGNAPFNTEADRIWITYVGSDEVFFSTSYFPTYAPKKDCEEKTVDSSGIDKAKPVYVRVNKTIWQPTRINAITDPDHPAGQDTRWTGEVFGLAPASNYECDFVSTADDAVIFSTSVRTLQPPIADTSAVLSPNPQVTGRPGSPTTTLKTSIASSEAKLSEEKKRQKAERKDQRGKLNSARKEIDNLNAKISSAGGSDDRQRQKIQQTNLHAKQAEDAANELVTEIRAFDTVPAEDASLFSSTKSEFHKEKEQQKKARSELNSAKEVADREMASLTSELTTLQQKRDRMQARITKLNGEHERITDANAKGLDEAQRKDRERQAKEAERNKIEDFYLERLGAQSSQEIETINAIQVLGAQIELMRQAEMEMFAATQSPTNSAPGLPPNGTFGPDIIPESLVAAANYPWNPAVTNTFYPGIYAPMVPSPGPGYRTRGRSSSMLSNLSGFTQSDGEGPGPLHPPMMSTAVWDDANRHGSSGSGSGSGSGPGSVGDPKSPVVGNGKLVK